MPMFIGCPHNVTHCYQTSSHRVYQPELMRATHNDRRFLDDHVERSSDNLCPLDHSGHMLCNGLECWIASKRAPCKDNIS